MRFQGKSTKCYWVCLRRLGGILLDSDKFVGHPLGTLLDSTAGKWRRGGSLLDSTGPACGARPDLLLDYGAGLKSTRFYTVARFPRHFLRGPFLAPPWPLPGPHAPCLPLFSDVKDMHTEEAASASTILTTTSPSIRLCRRLCASVFLCVPRASY